MLTCESCGAELERSYDTHSINAVERHTAAWPDGTAHTVVRRATVVCSWRCLAAVAATIADGPPRPEGF